MSISNNCVITPVRNVVARIYVYLYSTEYEFPAPLPIFCRLSDSPTHTTACMGVVGREGLIYQIRARNDPMTQREVKD